MNRSLYLTTILNSNVNHLKMKKIFILLVAILIATCGWTQPIEHNYVTPTKFVNISKKQQVPPVLKILRESFSFTDGNVNKIIDANESCFLVFKVKNIGQGNGYGLEARIQETSGKKGLNFRNATVLKNLQPDETLEVTIPVTGDIALPDGMATFKIFIREANNNNSDTAIFTVNTRKFQSPLVKMQEYYVENAIDNKVQKGIPFFLKVLIQNLGLGTADSINVVLSLPNQNIFCLSSNEVVKIPKLLPGKSQTLTYKLCTGIQTPGNEIRIPLRVTEKLGRFSQDGNIIIGMVASGTFDPIVVTPLIVPPPVITPDYLLSSVDKDIPLNSRKNSKKLALIIGNQNYRNENNVDYAHADALTFREYLVKTLGFSEDNVRVVFDLTASQWEIEFNLWFLERAKRIGPEAELILYYAGHGCPEKETSTPFIIPVDVTTSASLGRAIKVSDLYKDIASTKAGKVTIFMDACFSGKGRNTPYESERGPVIVPAHEIPSGNTVVFSACAGKQPAYPYPKEKHGIFTFFLLKKIQETNGEVNYEDLLKYLQEKVPETSLNQVNKPQDPEITSSPTLYDSWKTWKLR